jgi:hypothetical protein
MRYLFFLCSLLLALVSCTNVSFNNPQPYGTDSLTKIPKELHGIYEFENTSINSESYLVTDNSVGDMVLGDNLIIKKRGNFFYLNLYGDDNNYAVYVVRITQVLDYENFEILFLNITEDNLYLFNIENLEEVKSFDYKQNQKESMMFTQRPDYLINNINVNQLNQLINSSDKYMLKRVK